jgi:hypothetical protein
MKKTVILVLTWLGVPSSQAREFASGEVVERCLDALGRFMLRGCSGSTGFSPTGNLQI